MTDEKIYDNFQRIEEGDTVFVRYGGIKEMQHKAEIVESEDEDKIVSFLIPQTEPKIVCERDKVRMETRPLGKSRDWSEYTEIQELKIVEK